MIDHPSTPAANPAVRRLALAIIATASAASEVRALVERAVTETSAATSSDGGGSEEQEHRAGLLPTTKQAIQVAVAASLAIVVGELVSPSRWYWAVIAAFVIFAGTNTWNETLTKGWARLIGTALGVPAGVLVAAVVSGNRTASLVLIFVCVFCSLYFLKVAYSMMTFWITTMLALLYGLLGEFSYGLLLLRIEETAIGAVIGVTVAILVLPTNARTAMRNDARTFLTTLADVIETSVATLFGHEVTASPTDKARQLDRDLQQFRTTAKPLAAGVGGISGRHSIRHGQRMLAACDRYGRTLARNSERFERPSERLADAITSAATHIQHSIDVLTAALDGGRTGTVVPATDFLDAAETLGRQHHADHSARQRLLAIVHALRQIDRAVVSAAIDLGADDVVAARQASEPPVPVEEIQHRIGEDVVAIAGDHVSRTADIDELDLGEACQKFVGALLADQVAHLAPHQQHGYAAREDRLHRRVQSIDVGHLGGRQRRGVADELRIPMPVPAIAAAAQVCAQAVEIGWPGPMRVVLGDRIRDLVERLESRLHPVGHEVVYSVRPGRIHVGDDVHQDHRAGNAGRKSRPPEALS